MQLPKARQDDLLRTDMEGEVVLYDPTRHMAHTLNRAAFAVWNHCNGHNAIPDLQRKVSEELGASVDESTVRLALQELERANLLTQKLEEANQRVINRRDALRKGGRRLATAALLTPIVISALVPKPAAAASF